MQQFACALAAAIVAAGVTTSVSHGQQQRLKVMFRGHDPESPRAKGSTIVTRQSEGSGLGTLGEHEFVTNVWLYDAAPYQVWELNNPLATSPTTMDVYFTMDTSGSFPQATTYETGTLLDSDDVGLSDTFSG